MESKKKKKVQMKLFIKQRHRYRKQMYGYTDIESKLMGNGGGINWEIVTDIYILQYIK